MIIKLTKHAKLKLDQRNISLEDVKAVVSGPELTEPDRFDDSLIHFIGRLNDRFLRVIGKREAEEEVLVISAFFDRRISRRMKHDKA